MLQTFGARDCSNCSGFAIIDRILDGLRVHEKIAKHKIEQIGALHRVIVGVFRKEKQAARLDVSHSC